MQLAKNPIHGNPQLMSRYEDMVKTLEYKTKMELEEQASEELKKQQQVIPGNCVPVCQFCGRTGHSSDRCKVERRSTGSNLQLSGAIPHKSTAEEKIKELKDLVGNKKKNRKERETMRDLKKEKDDEIKKKKFHAVNYKNRKEHQAKQ